VSTPLLAAVPLLLSLVACILVLRLYPIPLARLVRATAARPGLVPFPRDRLGRCATPARGWVPVLAVVVGRLGRGVVSSVLLGTVRAGIDRSAV
jgi:putative ABC transport system permease protein